MPASPLPDDGVYVNDLAMKAVTAFKDGCDCETSIVAVFDDYLGIKILDGLEPQNRRTGLGFQVPCGAIMGAKRVLAVALENDPKLPELLRGLENLFARKHKGTTCQYLTARVKWGEHRRHCGKYVYSAVEYLCLLLETRLAQKLEDEIKSNDPTATRH
ncbi:MAG: hypothetical protein LBJ61_06410 [Deltaproteobacteria bacterium]|nr:hypothetical protein [Deltaproteobacteria bacterium]